MQEPRSVHVKLLSHTKEPFATVYNVWKASREDCNIDEQMCDEELTLEQNKEVIEVLQMDIPVAEMIDFVFLFDNIPITWREHVVRHRIGSKVGDNIGVDIIPDLASSSMWSQAIRIKDMSKFYDNGHYRVPESINKIPQLRKTFKEHIKDCQDLYNNMIDAGIERQEAREVFPLALTHRMTWKLNLASMKKILGKRVCWIAQATLWHPIIVKMMDELDKVNPLFRTLIKPPCIKNDCYASCPFAHENVRRIKGLDKVPPCALWMNNDRDFEDLVLRGFKITPLPLEDSLEIVAWLIKNNLLHEQTSFMEKFILFRNLWKHDPYTWKEWDSNYSLHGDYPVKQYGLDK